MGWKTGAFLGTLVCSLASFPAVTAQERPVPSLDLSSLGEGRLWEAAAGGERLRAERTDDVIEFEILRPGAEEGGPLLACVVSRSTCSIRVEEANGVRRIHLLREALDETGELVFEALADRFRYVAGSLSVSRPEGEVGRRRSQEPEASPESRKAAAGSSEVVLLRCPEGDTSMRLSKDEAEASIYDCPRHARPLEVAGGARTSSRGRDEP